MDVKFVWDKLNNNSWSEELIFQINPVKWIEKENNFEQTLQGVDGNWDFYCCGMDGLLGKSEYEFSFTCFLAQINALYEIYRHCTNTSSLYQWFRAYIDNYSGYKNLCFIEKFSDIYYKSYIPDIEQAIQSISLRFREK
ncbi:hypothetical protein HY745_08390 [Candidatus Desantisbacteria bacterium]|nr:hypothetical protein [Candidatus Desantisbacteria bacterium]